MASHQVAIAKASFAAALLKQDPTSISRDEQAHFYSLLDAALLRCSPANVQMCKSWLRRNVVCSSARTGALGRYLAALSISYTHAGSGHFPERQQAAPTPDARKCLHLLYLLNDLLHHTKYHECETSTHNLLTSNLQPHLMQLVGSAAAFGPTKTRKIYGKILEVVGIWQDNGYYSPSYVNKLREAVENAGNAGPDTLNALERGQRNSAENERPPTDHRDTPYVLPATHGDPSTPYYDLPAANMMPHVVPNSQLPINPSMIRPLQLIAGPAEERLTTAVKNLLDVIDRMYDGSYEDEGIVADIDQMGEPLVCEENGEEVGGGRYYGWSRQFCERMRTPLGPGISNGDQDRGKGQTGSRSTSPIETRLRVRRSSSSLRGSSRSRSRSPWLREQRRASRSRGSRSRSPRRSSRSRSQCYRHRSQSRSTSRYRSISRSKSRSRSRTGNGQRRRSYSYSPPPPPPKSDAAPKPLPRPLQLPQQQGLLPLSANSHFQQNFDPRFGPGSAQPSTQPLQPHFNPHFSQGPGGLPVPPPPPQPYGGTWPPPPPPPPASHQMVSNSMQHSSSPINYPSHSGFVPHPQPPFQGMHSGFQSHGGPPILGRASGSWINQHQPMQQPHYGGQLYGGGPPGWQPSNGFPPNGRGR